VYVKPEKVAINDALPLKTVRRDAIAKLKSFWGFESELQTNPMPLRLDSPWGATLMPLTACAMDWGRSRILRVGKNSCQILCRLWTKVDEMLGRCIDSLYFRQPLPDCLYRVSFRKYSPVSIEDVEKPNKCK